VTTKLSDERLTQLRNDLDEHGTWVIGTWDANEIAAIFEEVEVSRAAADRHYGKDCPAGMVQIEFVGCSPAARMSDYGWKPTPSAFLEVYVDGRRFRIDVGDFHDGKARRRGLHIVTDIGAAFEQTSLNAASVFLNAEVSAPPPESGGVTEAMVLAAEKAEDEYLDRENARKFPNGWSGGGTGDEREAGFREHIAAYVNRIATGTASAQEGLVAEYLRAHPEAKPGDLVLEQDSRNPNLVTWRVRAATPEETRCSRTKAQVARLALLVQEIEARSLSPAGDSNGT
jgi:hypothetical protein